MRQPLTRPHMTGPWRLGMVGFQALMGLVAVGCVEHRTAVNPPLPATPPPAGEARATTQLITGATITSEPQVPVTESSHLPIDVPVSVWRRESDGTISRGELRVTTALPWWQRFPADIVTDLTPIDGLVFASGTASFTPVATADRAALFAQAQSDGYARRQAPPKSSPQPAPATDAQGKPTP